MNGVGTADTRAIWIQSTFEPIDTLRFDNVVAYSGEGVPTLVTVDFSRYDVNNVRIWRSIFDSATGVTMEIKALGPKGPCIPDPDVECAPPSLSQMSVRETRMGADVVIDDDGDGSLPPHGGKGILVTIGKDAAAISSPAYIKTLDISNNLMVSKQGTGGYFIKIDSEVPGRVRAAQIVGNTFGEAIASAQGTMPAAVSLGADNILVSGNILHNAREVDDPAPTRVDYFAQPIRSGLLNAVLIGNVASVPLGADFLDGTAFPLGAGKQNLANTGQSLAFVQVKQLGTAQVPASGTAAENLNGLSFPVKANTNYRATGTFVWSSTGTGAGAGFGFNLPVAPVSYAATCTNTSNQSGTGPTTPSFFSSRAPNQFYVQPNVDTVDRPLLGTCTALFRTGAAGATVLNGRVRASAANTVTVLLGTTIKLEELP